MARGRPRQFDERQVLDAALAVFWRNGYQGASLAELTRATGLSKPSLYAAFGNKEQLYLAALARYRERQLSWHAVALAAEPDLTRAMRGFLRSVARMLTAPDLPGGCMVVTSAAACDVAGLPPRVTGAIAETVSEASFGLLQARLRAESRRGRLAAGTRIAALADYFAVFMSGMAVMAKLGFGEERLFAAIEHALRALPGPPTPSRA